MHKLVFFSRFFSHTYNFLVLPDIRVETFKSFLILLLYPFHFSSAPTSQTPVPLTPGLKRFLRILPLFPPQFRSLQPPALTPPHCLCHSPCQEQSSDLNGLVTDHSFIQQFVKCLVYALCHALC